MNTKNVSPHASRMSNLADGDHVLIDDRVSKALEEYAAALEKGQPLSREVLLEKYADVAEELAGCLDSLNFIRDIAPQIAEQRPNDDDAARQQTNQARVALGDYRIIRELGRGGMGVVYEAEQLSLGRSVALKVLPYAAMMDHKAITRFKNEARAAATLDHPHIVPVFAVGNERGIYYYAMSLIDGLTVAELVSHLRRSITDPANSSDRLSIDNFLAGQPNSIDNASLSHLEATVDSGQRTKKGAGVATGQPNETYRAVEAAISTHRSRFDQGYFRSVAGLGAQAAEALDHAHQHGIVHRDIKPGNLMIDSHAKLLVTDFGLARIESDAGMTMTGDLIGTLRYMSPEQALAKRIVVDHRADIYALGASLYELLALRPAFDGPSREALLRQIAFEEPKPLRHFNRAVPEDLQTIVHKALSKNPDDRYQTAQAMADDLHAFVDDEPIQARPLSIAQRTVKWATKRKGLVASVAGALLLAVTGLVVSNAMIAQQRDAAEDAQRNERAERLEADRQRKLAETAVAREKTERERAEGNFQQARATVDTYLTKVSEDELLNQPGMQPLRKELLELALKYYQEFIKQAGEDTAVQAELAAAYFRVASVNEEIGSPEKALQAHYKALEIRKKLVSANQENAEHRNDLTVSYNSLSHQIKQMAKERKDQEKCFDYLQQAIEIQETIVAENPTLHKYEANLSAYYSNLGAWYSDTGKPQDAMTWFQKAIDVREKLVAENPTLYKYKAGLSAFYNNLSNTYKRINKHKEALTSIKKSIELNEELVAENPTVLSYRYSLSKYYKLRGSILRQQKEKIAAYQKAVNLVETLVAENPSVPAYEETLADSYVSLAKWQAQDGKFSEAITLMQKGIKIHEKFVDTPRTIARQVVFNRFEGLKRVFLFHNYMKLGEWQNKTGRNNDSLASYRKAADTIRAIPEKARSPAELGLLGEALYRVGRWQESLQTLEKGNEVNGRPQIAEKWLLRGNSKQGWIFTMALAQLGETDKARSYYEQLVNDLDSETNPPRRINVRVNSYRTEAAKLLGIPIDETAEVLGIKETTDDSEVTPIPESQPPVDSKSPDSN